MRPRLLLLTWVAATVAATGVAWLGVRSVVDEVAAPLPAPAPAAATSGPDTGSAPASPPPTGGATPSTSEATTKTFTLVGGSATVRFAPDDVAVVSAVPGHGYEADVDADDGRTRVEFESDHLRSRLDVWWDGGPRHRIREQERGDDDRDDRQGDD